MSDEQADQSVEAVAGKSPIFATTHWSVVLSARDGDAPDAAKALENLCCNYWYPLYAFVRRQGYSPEDAQDHTQEFFARLLEKEFVGSADPARGRFRTFLLACLKNFLLEQRRHASRLKRGGGQTIVSWDCVTAERQYIHESKDEVTPETLYEKRWALTLLEKALARLGEELAAAGKERVFVELKGHLWGDQGHDSYAVIATRLEMTEGALKVAIHRLRQRYRELLREEVAHTVAKPEEIDEELRHLIAVVRI
jgi:RNA polymerase sigma-70 factor (ECF subfamily)